MNFSGANKKLYNGYSGSAGKRQSLVFIGDSITWGNQLSTPAQTFEFKIQQYINSKYGFTPATWGGGNGTGNYDIVARNVMMDDTTNSPFNGGQFSTGTIFDTSQATVSSAGVGIYPYSVATGNSTSVATKYSATWNRGAITLAAGSIKFTANYPNTANGYIVIGVMGAGRYQLLQGSTVLGTYTVGAIITATVSLNSATMTNISITYGTIAIGSYIYTSGYATGNDAVTVTSYTNGSSTLTMSAPSTIASGTYTFYALAGSSQKNYIGPFSANGSSPYYIKWISDLPVITMIHPTPIYPTDYTLVQINGRNSYGIADYSSTTPYADAIQKQIMAMTIHTDGAGYSSLPTYVITSGINDICDRPITPTLYATELTTLANALKNPSYSNYGRVILTIPLLPTSSGFLTGGASAPGGGSYTYGDYRKAIIGVAKALGLSYIDLQKVKLTNSDYVDGIHPNDSGTTKIAKYIISVLELNAIV